MSPTRKVSLVFLKLMIFSFGLINSEAQLTSIRVENSEAISSVSNDGQLVLFAERSIELRIFSNQPISLASQISFTNVIISAGNVCDDLRRSDIFYLDSVDNNTALVTVILTKSDAFLDGYLMICYRHEEGTNWIHQGNKSWMTISLLIEDDYLKVVLIWVRSVLIPVFLFLSAMFSGLSLTLLSLTKAELKVLRNQGRSEEKRYSKAVAPLRKKGNMLFCGLLLMNTLANVLVVVLLYELINLYSILAATLLIVFLGELVPQTICSKYGLGFGNKMGWLTDVFFILTLPFSYPVGKIMDLILDDEVPAVYNRDRFQELMAKPGKSADVANMIPASQIQSDDMKPFKLSNRTVGEVMVKLEDTFMEEYDNILTSDKVSEILKRGYTRIPVYEKERSNVVALLHIRDLTLIDPKDRLTLKAVCKFYNRPVNFVFEDTKLTVMLEEFKKGQSHMAFVQRVNSDGPGDPYYETLGMITLEDVIEDIFHSDSLASRQLIGNVFDPQIHFQNSKIASDLERLKFNQYLALHRKQKNDRDDESQVESLPTNLLQAIIHFLPTVPAFQPDLISSNVLERLLKQGSVVRAVGTNRDGSSSGDVHDESGQNKTQPIIEKDRPMDYFVLILEGRVQVTIGNDNLQFIEGPFTHFGHSVLTKAVSDVRAASAQHQRTNQPNSSDQSEYVPDFTVCPLAEVCYLKVPLSVYLSSLQATQLQRMNQSMSDVSVAVSSQADHVLRSDEFLDGETFVESRNAKNSFLNYQRSMAFPDSIRFSDGGELYPTGCYNPLSSDYDYHLREDPDSWIPRQPDGAGNDHDLGRKMVHMKSPSDEWLDQHIKREGVDCSPQEPFSDRSTLGHETPTLNLTMEDEPDDTRF